MIIWIIASFLFLFCFVFFLVCNGFVSACMHSKYLCGGYKLFLCYLSQSHGRGIKCYEWVSEWMSCVLNTDQSNKNKKCLHTKDDDVIASYTATTYNGKRLNMVEKCTYRRLWQKKTRIRKMRKKPIMRIGI